MTSVTVFSLAGVVFGSFAWFNTTVSTPQYGITGNSAGAFFAYGDGVNRPYGITRPRHLYNLAWLQYLGYFDDAGSGNTMNQYTFEISPNLKNELGEPTDVLDMSGWVLPPIGTAEHPFVGSFNGNNKEIANLTVSNDFSQYINHPSSINEWNNVDKQPEIVGFFGVVGELKTDLDYNQATNQIYDVSLDNLTIQVNSTSHKALIGFAAGYVNGTLDNVAIGDAKFNIDSESTSVYYSDIISGGANSYMPNISNYSTVGYCTNNYLKRNNIISKNVETPEVVNGAGANLGNQYGASIPMKDFYDHLYGVKGPGTEQRNAYSYTTTENLYYSNDVLVDSEITNTSTAGFTGTTSGNVTVDYSLGGKQDVVNGSAYASYTFANMNNSNQDRYVYLSGEKNATTNTTSYRFNSASAYVINSGNHYLNYSTTTAVTDGNNNSNLSKWFYENNRLYCVNTTNRTPYYLRSTGVGNLTLTTTPDNNCNWTLQDDGTFKNNSSNVYIFYNNGWSTCATFGTLRSIRYSPNNNTNNYLVVNGTNITNTTTAANANIWLIDNNNYYYTIINGTNYYLKYDNGLKVATGTSNAFYADGNFLYNGSRWVRYNNGWTTTTTRNQRTQLTFGSVTYTKPTSSTTTGYKYASSSTSTFKSNPTFFPLKFNYNKSDVSNTNTGYVVSGRNSSDIGDIRISQYYTSDLSVSFNSSDVLRYAIGNGGYYMGISNGNLTAVTSLDDAAYWNTSVIPVSTVVNGVTYYLLLNNNNNVIVSTSANGGRYAFGYYSTDGYFHRYNLDGSSRNSNYIYCNNGTWAIHTSGTSSTRSNAKVDTSSFEIITRVAKKEDGTAMNQYARISDNYNSNNSSVNSNISGLTKINHKELGLKKYSTARGYFENTLNDGGGNIYGLHFMEAQISSSNLVQVDKALMSGTEYLYNPNSASSESLEIWEHVPVLDGNGKVQKDEHDEMITTRELQGKTSGKFTLPQDCIDFSLAETGRINFFAGSYYSSNAAFFSLHQIFRNDTTKEISSIREITQVYENLKYDSFTNDEVPKYIYRYADSQGAGGYFSYLDNYESESITLPGEIKRSSTPIFDLSWITNPGINISSDYFNCAFYFEIPANAGEYALGSVNGKRGAYLMYLDIGASDESKEITIVRHVIETTIEEYSMPKGVDFVIITDSTDVSAFDISGGEVGTVVIPNGAYGNNITFTLVDTIMTCGPPSGSTKITKSTFIAEGYTFTSNNATLTLVDPDHITEIEQNIETKYTYDIEGSRLFTDINESITKKVDGVSQEVPQPDPIRIERTNITESIYNNNYFIAVNDDYGDTFVSFFYKTDPEVTVNITYQLKFVLTSGDVDEPVGYYKYVIYFDVSDDIDVFVTSIKSGFVVDFMVSNQSDPTLPEHYVTAYSNVTVSLTTPYRISKYEP